MIVGENGAGYAKPSKDDETYGSLVGKVVNAHPDLVIVSGGRNDVNDDPNTLRAATNSLFKNLRTRLPSAQIVARRAVVGRQQPHPTALATVDAAVKAGVESVDGTYLDVADPLAHHPRWMASEADPNDRGYAAIARKVGPAIDAILPR